jgi:hypothetical protein
MFAIHLNIGHVVFEDSRDVDLEQHIRIDGQARRARCWRCRWAVIGAAIDLMMSTIKETVEAREDHGKRVAVVPLGMCPWKTR